MKIFIIKLLIFICPIAIIMAVVNFVYDPANLFREGAMERQAAHLLAQGDTITGIVNCNERLLVQYYIKEHRSIKPNHLVLGSSRAMLIDSSFADSSYTFYNSAVSAASLKDVMALYWMWEESGAEIKKITIEVSPSWFNDALTESGFQSIDAHYNAFVRKLGLATDTEFNLLDFSYIQLLSPTYFKSSIQMMGLDQVSHIAIAGNDAVTNLRYPDGSIRYPLSYYYSNNISDKETQRWFKKNGFNFNYLSSERQLYFERFIGYLTSKNIEVELFINALHPILYDLLEGHYNGLSLVESFLGMVAEDSELVNLRGSYNPHKYGFTWGDFLDIVHPRKAVMAVLL